MKRHLTLSEEALRKSTHMIAECTKCTHRYFESLILNGEELSKDDRERSSSAVVQRFRFIKADCLKFENCVQLILALDVTGNPSDEDILRAEVALFNGSLHVTREARTELYRYFGDNPASQGKLYTFMNCY